MNEVYDHIKAEDKKKVIQKEMEMYLQTVKHKKEIEAIDAYV